MVQARAPSLLAALLVAKAAGVWGVDRSLLVTHIVTGRGKKRKLARVAYGGTSRVFFSVSGWCCMATHSDAVAQVVLS